MPVARIENLVAIISDPTSPDYIALGAENKYAAALLPLNKCQPSFAKKNAPLARLNADNSGS